MIKIIDLKKEYGNGKHVTVALNRISLEVDNNEFIAIIGKSGCGKSTLLNIIAGLTSATEGSVYIDETNITDLSRKELAEFRKKNIGIILQDSSLLDNLTVYQNIELPLKIRKESKDVRKTKIRDLLNKLDIPEIEEKFPAQLSGGQKQRVAIARAIVYEPAIILADEPTGALDDENAFNILKILKKLSKNTTILMVTHNKEIACNCNRVIHMKNGMIVKNENL